MNKYPAPKGGRSEALWECVCKKPSILGRGANEGLRSKGSKPLMTATETPHAGPYAHKRLATVDSLSRELALSNRS
ncbi:hypothetical protein BC351_40185 [Paenibacillus ferrarius]|uniref:Uncharacterized protein n=1 Tax=Paenibacillus ferrarius TaxID=1469647 RepID=A0A1V4H890_9BACL|nr:hypothetical protein BC351_40185 [Paenibacillus ferrarius]